MKIWKGLGAAWSPGTWEILEGSGRFSDGVEAGGSGRFSEGLGRAGGQLGSQGLGLGGKPERQFFFKISQVPGLQAAPKPFPNSHKTSQNAPRPPKLFRLIFFFGGIQFRPNVKFLPLRPIL